jgi:hypothetical protein
MRYGDLSNPTGNSYQNIISKMFKSNEENFSLWELLVPTFRIFERAMPVTRDVPTALVVRTDDLMWT